MISRRRLIVSIAIISLVTVASYSVMRHTVIAPFAERRHDADRAFIPLLDLNPAIFDNEFGVYIVEFGDHSASLTKTCRDCCN